MEDELYTQKEVNEDIEDFELLIIGINPSHAMQISKNI